MIKTNDLILLIKIIVIICALYIVLFSGLSRLQTHYDGEYNSNHFKCVDFPVKMQ
ncbi:hypothetical protein JXQ31_05745 [candidate division KSB1 bacterium]|nr:hypothetical protein [candidate division KSB1 bacterium]